MNRNRLMRGLSALSVLAISGCHSLDIENPNEPDRRVVSDPSAIEAVAGGSLRTFVNAYSGLRSAGVLSTQARTLSASWNNGNLNFYSGIDIGANDTVTSPATWTRNSRSWQNDPSSAGRTSVEAFWTGGNDESARTRPGFYAALSSANDALIAIRKNNIVIEDAATTKRAETFAQFIQGAAYMMLSLNYDKAYLVDEDTPLADVQNNALSYSDRKQVRDAAIAKLDAAITLANANDFTTDEGWTNGIEYTNVEIAQIANTMAAMTLAWYPRDAAEVATQVDWNKVLAYTQKGMSVGTPVNFEFVADGGDAWSGEVASWCSSLDTCRISTRVAHFLDPATQKDPYPLGIGNPRPNSPDKRLGDGSFGIASMVKGFGNVPKTASGGSDFAWSSAGEIQRPDRGYYQQSNIGHVRYDATGTQDGSGIYLNFGDIPIINATVNDLLMAEALLRIGGAGNATTAAGLINNTRVTRGGLSSALLAVGNVGSPSDGPCMANGRLAKDGGTCTLWSLLLYEYEVELLNVGPLPFYNQRHLPVLQATAWERVGTGIFNGPRYIQGLIPGTPREMPVPSKELGVKGEALYTFGGTGAANSVAP